MKINRLDALAAVALAVAMFHERSWMLVERNLQGVWRGVTQSPEVWALAILAAASARRPFVSAVCMAIALMSTTTSACSLGWLAFRWEATPGCTETWTDRMMLLSCIVACVALLYFRGKDGTPDEHPRG